MEPIIDELCRGAVIIGMLLIVLIVIVAFLCVEIVILNNKYNTLMAKQEQFDAMLQRLDAATTEIADDLKALREEIADSISDESLAKLDANIAKLETMGSEDDVEEPEEPQEPA